jgi:Predicted ATPase
MLIKFKEITFEGFKSPDRVAKLKFCSDNISIVYGDNGSGKTSLLKGLYSFLNQDEDYLKALNIKKIVCIFIVSIKNINTEYSVEVKYLEDKYRFDWKSFEKSPLANATSLSIAIERGLSGRSFSHIDVFDIERFFDTKHANSNALSHLQKPMKKQFAIDIYSYLTNLNKIKQKDVRDLNQNFIEKHAYVENLDTQNLEALIVKKYKEACFDDIKRINDALLTALNLAIELQTNTGPSVANEHLSAVELYENKDRLILALSSQDESERNSTNTISPYFQNRELKNRLVDFLIDISSIEGAEIVVKNPLIGRIFESILQELNSKSSVVARFNLLVKTFNDFLIDNKKLLVDIDQARIQVNSSFHSLDDLSSGERHILTLLVCVLFNSNDRNFLFIDEPEMSLNILWQEQLLPLLTTLVPNTQIIVASHSPFIVNERSDYLSELLVKRS